VLGKTVAFNSTGIEFALVALFIVLTIEQLKALGDSFPVWAGAAAAALAMMLVPATHQLIAGIVLVTAVLLVHYRKYRTDTMAGEADRG
jgi:predicted branched-subunit amino acid permease